MKKIKFSQLRALMLLLVFTVTILALFIGRDSAYTLPAENRWTLPTVVETYSSSDWLMPKLYGHLRLRKPPLAYWSMLLSSEIFGLNLFWVRFPAVIFAVLAVLLFYRMLERLGIKKSNVIAGSLALLTASGFYTYARIAALEMPMLFFTLGVYYGMFRLFLKGEKQGILISSFFLGMTLLTKSHATFVSFIFFLLLWNICYGEWDIFRKYRKEWMVFLLIFLAVALPWYLYLYAAHGSEIVQALRKEMLQANHHGDYNLVKMLAGILSLLVPYIIIFIDAVYSGTRKRSRAAVFFLLYFVTIIMPYIFTANQKMRYMVPLIPACAALIALRLDSGKEIKSFVTSLTGAAFILVPGILISGLVFWFRLLPITVPAVILAVSVYTFMMYRKKSLLKAFIFTGLFELLIIGVAYPSIGLWHVPDRIIQELSKEKVATLNRRPFFLPVRMKHSPFTDVTWWDNLDKAVENNALIYLPTHYVKKFEKMLHEHGYSGYEVYITWRRFNEFPKDRDFIEAFKKRDIDILREDTFFVKILK